MYQSEGYAPCMCNSQVAQCFEPLKFNNYSTISVIQCFIPYIIITAKIKYFPHTTSLAISCILTLKGIVIKGSVSLASLSIIAYHNISTRYDAFVQCVPTILLCVCGNSMLY